MLINLPFFFFISVNRVRHKFIMISIANKLLNECVYSHNKTIIYDCDTVSAVDNGSREKLFIATCLPNCVAIFLWLLLKTRIILLKSSVASSNVLPQRDYLGGFRWKLLCAASISKNPLIVIAEKQPTVKYISSPFVVERLNDSRYI